MAKSFEVTELPVRSAKFVARKQWVVAGADDMYIRVYNYNTMDKVKVFEAHSDYIRCVAVHPTLPYVLSSSDDMLIKLWDWEKGWACTQIFEGHSHYVMQVTFNPKDTNTFASASLDRTIKVLKWSNIETSLWFSPLSPLILRLHACSSSDLESWFPRPKFYIGCPSERSKLCRLFHRW